MRNTAVIPKPSVKQTLIHPEEFLTTKELMQLLKIKHRKTIYDLIAEDMPVILVGRSYRFIRNEVIAFLKKRTQSRKEQTREGLYGKKNPDS